MLLTVNTGSSSVRLGLFETGGAAAKTIAHSQHSLDAQPGTILREFLRGRTLRIVAHRVVHGGARFSAPCLIDDSVEQEIERLVPLAPLHNPQALKWMRACRGLFGAQLAQVAVFDTAFYAALPEVAHTYALPHALARQHAIRRYGFHGLAHQAMWQRWCALEPQRNGHGRVISLQLGAGCSISAIADGTPQDTSMGFSPLEGLVMATRCGDLDPGVLLYLQRECGMSLEALDHMLSQESGLLGVSGVSADMRALLASNEPRARLAVDLYCYRARKYIGAYLAVLGGADAIVFGGGVGEHAPEIRARILQGLEWAGIAIDATHNQTALGVEARITHVNSPVAVWVLPVDEAAILANEALALVGANT
ncbi:MAG: acetate/propionate family kinase [Pseudomonadota bacterium]|nr:acetate/propionate family kinase [Pseudomonadota bacterium]